jgi:hypothetical protein
MRKNLAQRLLMDWDTYIRTVVSTSQDDWLQSGICDDVANPLHNSETDNNQDAFIQVTPIFLRSNISVTMLLPSRVSSFVQSFEHDFVIPTDRDRNSKARSYYDELKLLWCGSTLILEPTQIFYNGHYRCILPRSSEVNDLQFELFRLINLLASPWDEDLEKLARSFDRNFSLCGYKKTSTKWP